MKSKGTSGSKEQEMRLVIVAVCLLATPALAGSCRYGSFDGHSSVSCSTAITPRSRAIG